MANNYNNGNGQRKFYSNIDGCTAVNKNGTTYQRVELEAMLPKAIPELRTVNGSDGNPTSVVNFSVAIHNRAATIKWLTGRDPEVSEDGTVWANITAWGDDATRLVNAMNRGLKYITLNGAITMRDYQDRQGRNRVSVEIRVYSFYLYNREKSGGNGQNNGGQQNNYQNQAPAQNNGGYQQNNGYQGGNNAPSAPSAPAQNNYGNPSSVFADLDDPDGELPF